MKILIKESSLVHVIVNFLDVMEHPKGVCHVETKVKDDGSINLRVIIKKEAFIVFGAGLTVGEIRKYYTDKVSDYIGVTPSVSFEIGKC